MATYRIQRKLFDDSYSALTQAAFSTDTKKELKTAAIAGGGLITLGSGILLAKNGKLGFNKAQREAAKKTYENLTRKLKNTLSEEAPKFENEKKFGGKGKKYTGKGLGGGETSPGKKYTDKSLGGGEKTNPGKEKYDAPKVRTAVYNKEDWKKILDYSKKNNRTRSEAVADLNIRTKTASRRRFKK